MESYIPKTIHYCWFGGNPPPDLAISCIESWNKWCPDYEIIRWDETNFDLEKYPYAIEAYEAKKWAFVTDVARLHILATYGGIYMDTDVEVVSSLDPLLKYHAVSGFESNSYVPTGLMASEPNHPMMKLFLEDYCDRRFVLEDGTYDLTTNTKRITQICKEHGLVLDNSMQTVNGFTLLPSDYLCPKDFRTGNLMRTENTIAIHHFDGSWLDETQKETNRIQRKLSKALPENISRKISRIIACLKVLGISGSKAEFDAWHAKKRIAK